MKKFFVKLLDIFTLPLTLVSGLWFKFVRKYLIGFWSSNAPSTKFILKKIGVFPIIDHYYDPYYNPLSFKKRLSDNRNLVGIDLRVGEQLGLIKQFDYNNELIEINNLPKSDLTFSFNNGPFLSGDAETLFNFVRYYKPQKIVEIGCGHSSLMIQEAIKYNKQENINASCNHICIEPFENEWLTRLDVEVIKKRVEDIDLSFFKSLNKDDILFIDSTHMIRPQGDVLFEYLELLPILKSGVIVHIHDIFTPRDYLAEWLNDGMLFWNEQYLLEAFLSFNNEFEILCSVNYLKNNYFDELKESCPLLTNSREPGSFWIKRK